MSDLLKFSERTLQEVALVEARQLELPGGDLIVTGPGGDAQLVQLPVDLHHEALNALVDGAEVVVVELLSLGGVGPEQGPAGQHQIRARVGELPSPSNTRGSSPAPAYTRRPGLDARSSE